MPVTLYGFDVSHPVQAARAMLELKGIEYRFFRILPGMHPLVVKAKGFPAITVPALEIDGEKVQGSTRISRRLDELVPDPPLFPADPEARQRVEAAERWGDEVLQPIPRRLFRWGLAHRQDLRTRLGAEIGVPLPAVAAALSLPQARVMARIGGASEETVRAHARDLPQMLDHVDGLLADGVLGGEAPNAADLQIGASINALLGFDDFRAEVEGRPCARLAERFPAPPTTIPRLLA